MCGMDIDLEDIAMGKKEPLTMPEKKTKIADRMEELERFALKASKCKALSAGTKATVKKNVRSIREALASEYTK